jgi:hypothetical protein
MGQWKANSGYDRRGKKASTCFIFCLVKGPKNAWEDVSKEKGISTLEHVVIRREGKNISHNLIQRKNEVFAERNSRILVK